MGANPAALPAAAETMRNLDLLVDQDMILTDHHRPDPVFNPR
jgi:hypothetical protein